MDINIEQCRGGNRPLTGVLADLAHLVHRSVIAPARRHICRRACKRALMQLDDHLLRDIGLTRSEADAIAHGLLTLADASPRDADSRSAMSGRSGTVRPRPRGIPRRADAIPGLFVQREPRR